MRFLCDNDIAVSVARALRQLNHEVWTAAEAGLADATDDQLTVYADDRGAVLLTHDRRFSQRRRENVAGKHVWLQCREMDAAELLLKHLPDFVAELEHSGDLWVRVHQQGYDVSRDWS